MTTTDYYGYGSSKDGSCVPRLQGLGLGLGRLRFVSVALF